MARSNEEAIEMFMSITGVSEATAIQKLQEHGGDLNEAVNAHFSEEDQNRTHPTFIAAPVDDFVDVDDEFETESRRPPFSLLSFARNLSPFSLLDRNFSGSIFDSFTGFTSHEPFVSHPREVREIPIEVKDGTDHSGHSGSAPMVEDVTGSVHDHGPEIHGTVTIDDDDDDDDDLSTELAYRAEEEKALRELEGKVGESEVIQSSLSTDLEKGMHSKLDEEQEIERQMAAKEASLPPEPAPNDENAVTLLVRMPDGSRRGRRFLKSDKLQCVFDFIDVGRVVKPGTYRLVTPYPRRAFSENESALTLTEIQLSSKQEALFLESI